MMVGGKYAGPSQMALLFISIALFSWIAAYSISIVPVALWLYNTARPATASQLSLVLKNTKLDYSHALIYPTPTPSGSPQPTPEPTVIVPDKFLPKQDPALAPFPHLTIPKIGIDTGIWEATTDNYEDALRRGVWRVPEFGDPTSSNTSPMILVAHRYGYLEWTNAYRRANSFFNLPQLKVGDEIDIAWDQRPFKYRVVKVEEASEIKDYSHPLIMYTCKYLVSTQRIVVYADKVE